MFDTINLQATGIITCQIVSIAMVVVGGAITIGMMPKKARIFPRLFLLRNITAIIQNLFTFCIIDTYQLTARRGLILSRTLQNDRFIELLVSSFL